MKLLLDQNLSRRLVSWLNETFPGTTHVTLLGMSGASDETIWQFARDNGYAILSKDADFHHLSFQFGAPPKTIWIDLGNCSTDDVRDSLSRDISAIQSFLGDKDSALLILSERGRRFG